jgi:ATP-dependent DNA ligase
LDRYVPELLEPVRAALPARCVLDVEMVIVKNDGLEFDALQLRLHPA